MSSRDVVLDHYRIEAVVGRGAFSRVLRVVDTAVDEPRALKVVTSGDRASEAMLLDEYAQLARLAHPSLPKVYDVGRTATPLVIAGEREPLPAGAPFLVAAWIAGGRVDEVAWDREPGAIVALIADVAAALAAIHGAGLVHGDVAPQNILFASAARDAHVLVDLGLASTTGVRGTPAYMAPEAFAGHATARGDLYGLAATIVRLVDGAPPYAGATLGELVERVVRGGARPRLAGLPRPLADLVERMLARDPDARPASAAAVLAELASLAPAIGVAVPAAARAGATAPRAPIAGCTWPGASATIAAIAAHLDPPRATVVVGELATGAHALVDAAIRDAQLARLARGERALSVTRGSIDQLVGHANAIGAALRARAAPGALVVVELGDDPRAAAALAQLAETDPILALVDTAPARDTVATITARRLAPAELAELVVRTLGASPPDAWIRAFAAATDGLPLAALDVLDQIAGAPDPFAVDLAARTSSALANARGRRLAAVSPAARRIALAAALWGGRTQIARALATARLVGDGAGLAEVGELERAGLARRTGDELVVDSATAEAALAGDLEAARALADATVGWAAAANLRAVDLAPIFAYASVGDPAAAARACDVAEALLADGRADRALALARRAIAKAPARANLLAARAAAAIGDAHEARPLATAAIAAGADPIVARLAIARALQRGGDLDAAETLLAELYAGAGASPGDELAGVYARLLVTRARFAEARAIAEAGGPLVGLRAEAAGLAAFYLGALDDADRAFAALEVGATAAGDRTTIGRALSLRGMVAQQRGQLGLAADRYAEAARLLVAVGAYHAAASAELNLGTVLAERGRASEALPRLAAAARVFGELGATTELCAAELNRGNACLAVGQPSDALAAARSAVARAGGAPHLRAFALLVSGDAHRALGDRAAALAAYAEALAIAVARGDAHAEVAAHVALAEAGVISGDPTAIAARCSSPDDHDRWTLAHARLQLVDGPEALPGVAVALPPLAAVRTARACAAAAIRAERADRLERAFRAHAVAALVAARATDPALLADELAAARASHGALVAAAAPAFRAAMARDRDAVAIAELARTRELDPPTEVASSGERLPLRRLLVLSRRLNSEASLQRILDEVIDTAIELAAAERGFLLLRDRTTGELAPVVSRNFDTGDLEPGAGPSVSRSIAERAAQTGEAVVTVDAGVDERWSAIASVAALRLQSVLAVPLRQRGAITGCIYLDHRLQRGAFDDGAAAVVAELADIAAVAIENARLADELRTASRALDTVNARLADELAERDAELVRVKADLPDRDRLSHRYERIVGRSPAMARVLGLVDRAASTSLPIVIVGESGTGKELVARALHDHGPRAGNAFVAINCSAVPEPLLESELFGHVRGAFTGADRDRRGLFEVADGGTLFLDEVAEMSLGMQAKLLRILQDGVVRRVGDSKTKQVDVRVVAATQLPLATLAERGKFREDLRYRLEVIAIPMPPLRDREGDIPILVEHVLAQICAGRAVPKLTRAALRALVQHRWPGNVRELHNALARGVAMGGDVIDVDDLPEAIARAPSQPAASVVRTQAELERDANLNLKPALLLTEQAYVGAAMTRAKNNQTVAARLLGISRFGLQKKLRRLAGEPVEDDD